MKIPTSRTEAAAMDARDPLANKRADFHLPENVIYLVGHSLGPPSKSALSAVKHCAEHSWAEGLVGSWNSAGWFELAKTLGGRLSKLIGADPAEIIVTDTVSVNLFKLAAAALPLSGGARQINIDKAEFPTDQYIADSFADLSDIPCHRIEPGGEMNAIASGGIYIKSAVNFRSAELMDMARYERAAGESGAIIIWDLSHATGVAPLNMHADGVRLATGCTYKYLNGGPGAPSFIYTANDWLADLHNPLPGWMGHAQPFAFKTSYEPMDDASRFASGTPPILSLTALGGALNSFDSIDIKALHAKAGSLGDLCIARAEAAGLTIASPRKAERRGGHVSIKIDNGYPITRALFARGIHTDFRTPDTIRFGLSPLYVRFTDIWDTMEALTEILETRSWDRPEFKRTEKVT